MLQFLLRTSRYPVLSQSKDTALSRDVDGKDTKDLLFTQRPMVKLLFQGFYSKLFQLPFSI